MVEYGGVGVEYLVLPVGAFAVLCGIVVDGSLTAINCAFVDHCGVFGGVEHVAVLPRILDAKTKIVSYLGCACLAFLGGNEDDAVGSPRTVNRARCSVLQYLDRLDVVGVEVVDAAVDWHTVHDVEGVGIVDGAHATDADLRALARLTGSGSGGNARGHTFQGVVHADACALDVVGGDA